MNWNIFIFHKLAIFFTISVFVGMESAAMDSTSTSETEEYEPLYVIEELRGFSLTNFMIFDEKNQKRIFVSRKGHLIGPACPIKYGNPNGVTLKVVGASIAESITWRPLCDNPVKFLVVKKLGGDQFSIGFVVYQRGSGYSHLTFNENLPKDHIFISFLVFQFQREGLHTVHVWHNIDFGKLIQIESEEPINNKEYEKNQDIFELDIDKAYSLEQQQKIFFSKHEVDLPCPLVKIQSRFISEREISSVIDRFCASKFFRY